MGWEMTEFEKWWECNNTKLTYCDLENAKMVKNAVEYFTLNKIKNLLKSYIRADVYNFSRGKEYIDIYVIDEVRDMIEDLELPIL